MDELIAATAKNELITAHRVSSEDFVDWEKYLNKLYRQFDKPGPGIEDWQLFSCSSPVQGQKVTMKFRNSNRDDANTHDFELEKHMSAETRKQLFAEKPESISKPGLREIKQCEMFFKYRPLVPEEYCNVLCPKLTDDVIEHVRKAKSDKGKAKRQSKKRARTASDGVTAMVGIELAAVAHGELSQASTTLAAAGAVPAALPTATL